MKKSLCFLLTLCLMAGMLTAALAGGPPEGKPWVNPELPGNLPEERPGLEEHYYLYVNYDLHRESGAGTDAQTSIRTRVEQEMAEDLWKLVETGDSTEARALRILTSLIRDGERREKDGLAPLMEYVRRVRETRTVEELSALCREDGFLFGSPFATLEPEPSVRDPEKCAIMLFVSSFVPERSFGDDEPQPEKEEDRLDRKKVAEELTLLGWETDSAARLATRLVQFQMQCSASANTEASPSDAGEAEGIPTTAEILSACTPLHDQLAGQGMIREDEAERNIYQTYDLPAFRYIQSQYRDENLDLFQAVICLSMVHYAVNYLDPATYARAQEITGDPDLKQAAYEYMKTHARFLTEQAYADAFIPAEQRTQVRKLAEECKQAMADRMLQCDWISEASRKKAAEKASAMKVVIVTPEERIDYAPLLDALSRENITLLQAAALYDRTDLQLLLRLAGSEYDRGHRFFSMASMLSTDAIYNPDRNTFYLMAGILRPPFYSNSSREALLGTLGFTIAHELSHGYDSNGILHDREGRENCVLTPEDLEIYRKRAQRLTENLSRVELADGMPLDGAQKLTEATADLLGLRLTLNLAKQTEGFDYDLFFRTLARNLFRSFRTREEAMDNYAGDYHPAYYIRTNYTFSQFEEFYRTYPAIQEGTGMYYPPESRESLW